MATSKITHDQIRDALSRSGYLIEYYVEKVLGRSGFMAEANQVYPDPMTGKARELDVAAIGCEPITKDYKNTIWPRLLIECVNNPQPLCFFIKQPVAQTVHANELNFSGLPAKIKQGNRWISIGAYLGIERYHHHCKGKIATQFCSFTPKKNTNPVEWLAQHEDSHFDSFNKLCFALNYEIDDHYSHAKLFGRENINLQLYYPIVVVSGELTEIVPTRKDVKLKATAHIHFVQSHFSGGKQRNYHIDVVTEKGLPSLLKTISGEIQKTARLLRSRRKVVDKSIASIVASAQRLRSPAAIRERLEYRPY